MNKKKRTMLTVVIAIVALCAVSIVSFLRVPAARKVIFSAGCVVVAGTPVVTEEFCHTSYKCLSKRQPARDAASACGDDFDCQGACVDREPVASTTGPLGIQTCQPQFGCDPERGVCSATRSVMTYYHRYPGCGL